MKEREGGGQRVLDLEGKGHEVRLRTRRKASQAGGQQAGARHGRERWPYQPIPNLDTGVSGRVLQLSQPWNRK